MGPCQPHPRCHLVIARCKRRDPWSTPACPPRHSGAKGPCACLAASVPRDRADSTSRRRPRRRRSCIFCMLSRSLRHERPYTAAKSLTNAPWAGWLLHVSACWRAVVTVPVLPGEEPKIEGPEQLVLSAATRCLTKIPRCCAVRFGYRSFQAQVKTRLPRQQSTRIEGPHKHNSARVGLGLAAGPSCAPASKIVVRLRLHPGSSHCSRARSQVSHPTHD